MKWCLLIWKSRSNLLLAYSTKQETLCALENWTPIKLLNIYYKLTAYVEASRLKKVMPDIINTDQNGYIKIDIYVFNIRKIQDIIIDYSERFKIDSCILFFTFC